MKSAKRAQVSLHIGIVFSLALSVAACDSVRSLGPISVPPTGTVDTGPPFDTVALPRLDRSQVRSGSVDSCLLRPGGTLICWGNWGRLGSTPPVLVTLPLDSTQQPIAFASIDLGSNSLCALSVRGEAYCLDRTATLVRVQTRHRFRQLANGGGSRCALTPSGEAYCWGDGVNGSLGTGLFGEGYQEMSPSAVRTSLRFATLSASGGGLWCGITIGGATYCWGGNFGSVYPVPEMVGDCADSYWLRYHGKPCAVPVRVPNSPTLVTVSTGTDTLCGVDVTHQVYCWGIGPLGQLGDGRVGDGAFSFSPMPVAAGPGPGFAMVSMGGAGFGCGLTVAGGPYCWGNNFRGFLGVGDRGFSATPIPVAGALVFVSLSAGTYHTCATSASDEVWCWGSSLAGELGRSESLGDAMEPIRVLLPPL